MTDPDNNKTSKIHLNSTPCCQNDHDERQSDSDDYYQVDTISTSSCQDDGEKEEEEDDGYDGAIVAASGRTALPHFGSVSVVNSNDVHFGNRTVYKGPVTIKQFVYPNGGNVLPDGVDGYVKNEKAEDVEEGVVNPSFAKSDGGAAETKGGGLGNGLVGMEVRKGERRSWKGFSWISNLSQTRPIETTLLVSFVLVCAIIILAVVLWRFPISKGILRDDFDEEDNNTPVDYYSDSNATIGRKLRMVSRQEWLAQPPLRPTDPLRLPVSLVIVHHTATESCSSHAQCIFQTRHIQTFHIESNGWFDIGYNFLLGGDGEAYEGRGWKKEGAHTFSYNNQSVGIAFIGTFINEVPPLNMINSFNLLVAKGVESGYITKNYKIMAARQLHATESPGKKFYEVIKTWSHWTDKMP